MMLVRLKGLSVILVLVALTSVGCCTRFKKEIERLQRNEDDRTALIESVQAELSKAETKAQGAEAMRVRCETAESALAGTAVKIMDLEAKLADAMKRGARPNGGPRGETTLYKHTVGSDVLFSSGRATLTARGKAALASVVAKIKADYPGNIVRVYGHTDNDPIKRTKKLWADNLDLSANRAMAVARHLMDKGLSPSKIETIGMGESRPIADNKTKSGKAKNRRVEIVIVK